MSRQSRELKKQQERAKKYGCDGRCYWSTGMCPSVEINPMAALFGAMMQQAVQNQQDPERQEGDPKGSEIESDDDE